ncbi:MAG: NAD(P)/FAD-dependent oxidoreductase [Gemmatimonadetes bacterium]|nr:NAD(P)/FAD-dependent oxidoreductase [Gemmatimonadota bacterium]
MSEEFDLVVLGTGAGGSAPATKCREAGWRVAVVDDQPYGGTCALRGCDPKKVLVGAAELVDRQRRMQGYGVAGEARIDWGELMRFKRTFTEPVPGNRERALEKAGIETLHGEARFTAEDRLAVGDRELVARHVVIATGARPAPLGIPGEAHVLTSTDFLELDALPSRIAFIGAGYVSFEFAHIVQRAGSDAIVLGRGRPLGHFDPDLVDHLVAHTRALGVDLRLDTRVIGVHRDGNDFRVEVEGPDGTQAFSAGLVVHGAGRTPDLARLDLARAGVEFDPKTGVVVNEFLQSVSNPRVYAAGDATLPRGSAPLTPVAAHEGVVVAANLRNGNAARPDYRGIASVVFTLPPLASVGIGEAEARDVGIEVRIQQQETAEWFSNRRVREGAGMVKTLVDPDTDRVLGAHLLGAHADEVINVFALAIRHGITATELRHMIYAYPTSGSDLPYML